MIWLLRLDAALLRAAQAVADALTRRTGLSCYWLAAQLCALSSACSLLSR